MRPIGRGRGVEGKRTPLSRLVSSLAMASHLAVIALFVSKFGTLFVSPISILSCEYGKLKFSGGFGSSMVAMDERTYNLIGADYPGNRAEDVKNPRLGWMTGFLFVVSFLGLFSLVPLRKVTVLYGIESRHLFLLTICTPICSIDELTMCLVFFFLW